MKLFNLVPALLLFLSGVAASDQPHGGSSSKDVRISDITVHTDGGSAGKGYVILTFSSTGTSTPSCASGYPRDLIVDMSIAGGAFAAAVAQSSFLTGSAVTVTGSGTCSVVPTAETLASIRESGRD